MCRASAACERRTGHHRVHAFHQRNTATVCPRVPPDESGGRNHAESRLTLAARKPLERGPAAERFPLIVPIPSPHPLGCTPAGRGCPKDRGSCRVVNHPHHKRRRFTHRGAKANARWLNGDAGLLLARQRLRVAFRAVGLTPDQPTGERAHDEVGSPEPRRGLASTLRSLTDPYPPAG